MEAWVMARAFNGGTDQITISAAPVTAYPWTIACWLLTTSLGSDQIFFGVLDNGGANHDQFYIGFQNSSGKLFGGATDDSGSFFSLIVGSAISTSVWYPVVWTGTSATNRTIYVLQGGSVVSLNDATNIVNNTHGATTTRIGIFNSNLDPVTGNIAECAVWNVALTSAEATAYCQGSRAQTIRSSALKGYWPLGGIQSPEPDLSGNKNNGTLTGTNPAFGPPIAPFTPQWPQFFPSMMSPSPFVLMPQIVT
jgi:hypothetical protein